MYRGASFTSFYFRSHSDQRNIERSLLEWLTNTGLMERLVDIEIMNFLNEHNKLNPSQHGFRSGHSCQTQLLEMVRQWANSLDRWFSSHVLFLDFSKAFDRVPHRRLLLKLDCMPGSTWAGCLLPQCSQAWVITSCMALYQRPWKSLETAHVNWIICPGSWPIGALVVA